MDVRRDAAVEFERQAREAVDAARALPPGERREALLAEMERFSAHRYLFVAEAALAVLYEALEDRP